MKIKQLSIRALALWGVAMAMTACNFEDQLVPERVTSDPGRIAFECEVDGVVNEEITRAGETTEGEQVPEGKAKLPDFITNLLYTKDANGNPTTEIDKSKLALRIWGTYDDPSTKEGDDKDNLLETPYARGWDPMTDYENIELQRGYYQARIESRPEMKAGKIAEAVNNPYFVYETAEKDKFQVKALETIEVAAEMKLMNSCFKLQTTQALMDYYTELELVIHTADGEFKFNPTKSTTSTVAGGTATTPEGTNEIIAWNSDADKLYFFNVSEPIKIDGGKSNGLVETQQSEFTTGLRLSGWAKKQNGVKVYFTTNGKPDGEPAVIKPVDDAGKAIHLAAGTMYTLRVGHKTAGSAGLTITYNDYGEAEVKIIELRPEETEEDNTQSGSQSGSGSEGSGTGTGSGTGSGAGTGSGDESAA